MRTSYQNLLTNQLRSTRIVLEHQGVGLRPLDKHEYAFKEGEEAQRTL